MARVLFTFGLDGLHLATVLCACGSVALHLAWSFLMVARVLFTLGLVGLHLARVLSTFGLVALHLACSFFNFG